jgi:hypothetical protein
MAVADDVVPLPGMPAHQLVSAVEQLALLGQPQPVRVPERLWRSWLDGPSVLARFDAKCYGRESDRCTVWLGSVSSTGHGSFRSASLPGPSRRGTVPAHLFAFSTTFE